uniref:Uncharacterized protein n=1 Tax=Daphnia magna TaxID=35525 RepID=A0A0N7ZMS0_9CRUS
MSIPLRICSACNLILALIVLLVQSMILSNYKNLQVKTYSQYTAVGIWTALLLACNGASMLLYLKRKFLCKPQQIIGTWLVFSSALQRSWPAFLLSALRLELSTAFYRNLRHLSRPSNCLN